MKKTTILVLLITPCFTQTSDFTQKASALMSTVATHGKKIMQTTKEIAQEFGNDIQGAGTDAQEIAQDIKEQWNAYVVPMTKQIIEAIKDPFEDIPDVIQDLQEMYAVTQGYVDVIVQPLKNAQDQLISALAGLQETLGITIITPKKA